MNIVGIPNQPARNGTYTELATMAGEAVIPKVGMRVNVSNSTFAPGSARGFLIGQISEITENWLVITPEEEVMRDWMPDGFTLGRAHWHPSEIFALISETIHPKAYES